MKTKKLVLKYRFSYFLNIYLAVFGYFFIFGLIVFSVYSLIEANNINISNLIKDNFFVSISGAFLVGIFGYVTYLVQKTTIKKESISIEYYKNILVPLYSSIRKHEDIIRAMKFSETDDRINECISDIDSNFYIPYYLKNELDNYNKIYKQIIKMQEEVNRVFYDNAFPKKKNNIVGILSTGRTNYIKNYLTDKNNIFTYCKQGEVLKGHEQKRYNKIVSDKIEKTIEFTLFIDAYKRIKSSIQALDEYCSYMIKKVRKRLI